MAELSAEALNAIIIIIIIIEVLLASLSHVTSHLRM